MAIINKLLPDGGFVCGDDVSGKTSYAYPTSTHATLAKRVPFRVADAMLANETRYGMAHEADYDARNWQLLGGR